MAGMKFNRPAAVARLGHMLEVLTHEPMNVHDLAIATNLSRRWTYDYLKHLHSLGNVYILRWDKEVEHRRKRHAIAVYAAGQGEDATRPMPDSRVVVSIRAWSRLKEDSEKLERVNAMRRVRHRIKKSRPDPAAAWLFNAVTAPVSSPHP